MSDWEKALKEALAKDAAQQVDPNGPHLDDLLLLEFLNRELAPDLESETRHHLANCIACTQRMNALWSSSENDLRPVSRPQFSRIWPPVAAFAAALVLAMLWTGRPQQPPISVSPMRHQLRPSATRSESILLIPSYKDALDLQLYLEPTQDYPSYRLLLTQGERIQRFEDLPQEGGTVSLILSKSRLKPGPLHLALYGNTKSGQDLLTEHHLILQIP